MLVANETAGLPCKAALPLDESAGISELVAITKRGPNKCKRGAHELRVGSSSFSVCDRVYFLIMQRDSKRLFKTKKSLM